MNTMLDIHLQALVDEDELCLGKKKGPSVDTMFPGGVLARRKKITVVLTVVRHLNHKNILIDPGDVKEGSIRRQRRIELSLTSPGSMRICLEMDLVHSINIKTDDNVDLQFFNLPHLERIHDSPGSASKFLFTIPSKSEFRFSNTQRNVILKAMGPGGEVEVIGQKQQNVTMKEENVQEQKSQAEDVDKAEEARNWTTFMFINCYFVFAFSIAMYINCCDYGGEWAEDWQEWEEEEQRQKEAARLKEAAKRKEAEELKEQKKTKKDGKEGKKGVEREEKETNVEAKRETKKGN